MARGYWIGRGDVWNPEAYQGYMAANGAAFAKFGGRFLVRGGAFEGKEGSHRSRQVIVEFPDYAAALACYHSPEYAAARLLRDGAAVLDLVIVEGV